MNRIKNPILPGFYPDPSICAVGEDYYLVTSSFAYFPGVPIFHSKDMINWEQIGHVLTRESQLNLTGCGHSEGIFAPTIRYNNGIFYMITTNVSGGGNFIVTAERPEGPWSEPYYLGEAAAGIDPSLFFDEDGTCYYVGTRPNPDGVRYNGDWEIWVQKLSLETMQLVGESKKIWKGAMNGVIWPEGPHLYKKDGYYYLMIAEGGTGPDHSVTIARCKDIFGPYEGNPCNPILTHRHLGTEYPIRYVGHGDLVETTNGQWYMVMLASRPCEGYTNLGRETFLAKVVWENDWPVVNPGIGMLLDQMEIDLPVVEIIPKQNHYHFYGEELDHRFISLRNNSKEWYSISDREGFLRLSLRKDTLVECGNPSYICIRQQHYHYTVSSMMEFTPKEQNECAGLAIVQNNLYHMKFEYVLDNGDTYLQLALCENGVYTIVNKVKVEAKRLFFLIKNVGQKLTLYYSMDGSKYILLKENLDTSFLSTEIAGGFVGCTIGMYASSNGKESDNYADFAWLSYESGGCN